MRTFDDFEKNILRYLKVRYDKGILENFASLLDNDLEDKSITVNNQTNSVTIGFDNKKYMPNNNSRAFNFIDEP